MNHEAIARALGVDVAQLYSVRMEGELLRILVDRGVGGVTVHHLAPQPEAAQPAAPHPAAPSSPEEMTLDALRDYAYEQGITYARSMKRETILERLGE